MNTIREAILSAASSIALYPARFDFSSCAVPLPGCNTPGCALGWIGSHLDLVSTAYYESDPSVRYFVGGLETVTTIMGIGHHELGFYARMDELSGLNYNEPHWTREANACATTLRAYADRYHPAKKVTIPAPIRAIFDDMPVAEAA